MRKLKIRKKHLKNIRIYYGSPSIISEISKLYGAQTAGAAEYTDCISAEELDSSNECLENDTKKTHGEVPVILELWGMRSTLLSLSLPAPVRPGEVAPDRVLLLSQIELHCVLMQNRVV